MKRKTKIVLIIFFGSILGFNVIKPLLIKRFFAHYEPPAINVSAVTAKYKSWKPRQPAIGHFVAKDGVDVNAELAGNVTAIHFNSSQFVEKGEPLVDLDDSIEQATLKFNQAELALQTSNYNRQADLLKHNATSNASVDDAKAKLLEAEANVEKTQAEINQKHITAPFAGMLGIREVNLGQYVRPGETTIVTLQSMDPLFLEFYLPEQLLGQIHLQQAITFHVEQYPNLRFKGIITAINAKVDPNTHMIRIQSTVPNCPRDALESPQKSSLIMAKQTANLTKTLDITCDSTANEKNKITQFSFIPGLFAAIDVEQPDKPNTLVLPTSAISYTLYGSSVFVIDKHAGNDSHGHPLLTVRRVFIKTGDEQDNETVVTQGIQPDQRVVSVGALKLEDGTRITIDNTQQLPETGNSSTLDE